MYKAFQPFFLVAEAPVHAGSGSEVGIVDLPIQRERYTGFPKIEGSGIKGCVREAFVNSPKQIEIRGQKIQSSDKVYIDLVFGPEKSGDDHAGSISFTDARIFFFPVKSLKGIFAWVTCPLILARFTEDMKRVEGKNFNWDINNLENTASTETQLIVVDNKIVLEEFTFEVTRNNNIGEIAKILADIIFPADPTYSFWREKFKKDIVVLKDDDFKSFVTTSTEVIVRTKIDSETGTVANGALWTEEYLPQDTILYSIAMATHLRTEDNKKGVLKSDTPKGEAENIIEFFKQGVPEVLHIGGNQTIGKGIVRINIM